MQRRATEVAARRKELQHKRTSLADERTELARDNQLRRRVHDFAARIHAVIDTLDDTQKQELLRLLIEDVRVTGWNVQIRLRIALDPPPDPTSPPHPTGKPPSQQPRPVSSQNSLRSVSGHLRRVLPNAPHRPQEGSRQNQLANHPQRSGDFSWPPVGTSTWPLTHRLRSQPRPTGAFKPRELDPIGWPGRGGS